MPDLSGKSAIVTGAANGIGQGIANALAESGAHVAIADVRLDDAEATAAGLRERGLLATAFSLDVLDEAQIARVVAAVRQQLGSPGILVNNAGGTMSRYGTILDLDPGYFDIVFALNVRSTYLMCREVVPLMIEAGGGSIVNISSVGAFVAGPGFALYGAAKAAVLQLTRAMAVDFAGHNIRANVICPGSIETAAIGRMFASRPDPEAARRQQSEPIPLKRLGSPLEIGRVAAFLASDEASYVTASVQVVDGGFSAAH